MNLEDTKVLVEGLMDLHNLKGWSFKFDSAKRRFGACHFSKKMITLSKSLVLINKKSEIEDTILHEIAHALVGPGYGHCWVWKSKAISIGCTGDRCYKSVEVEKPVGKHQYQCPNCKKIIQAYKIWRVNKSCSKCSSGRYNPMFKFIKI